MESNTNLTLEAPVNETSKKFKTTLFLKLFIPFLLIIVASILFLYILNNSAVKAAYNNLLALDYTDSSQNNIERSLSIVKNLNDKFKKNLTLIGFILSFIVIAVFLFWYTRIIYPLKRLARITKELNDGNLISEYKIITSDEIGTISENLQSISQRFVNFLSKNYIPHNIRTHLSDLANKLDKIIKGNLSNISFIEDDYFNDLITKINTLVEELKNVIKSTIVHGMEIANIAKTILDLEKVSASNVENDGLKILSISKDLKDGQLTLSSLLNFSEKEKIRFNNLKVDFNENNSVIVNIQQNLDESYNLLNNITEKVEGSSFSFNEINNVIEMIKELSREANVLAVNTSIEIAKSKNSDIEMSKITEEIRELTEKNAHLLKDIIQTTEESADRCNEVKKMLSSYRVSHEEISNQIGKVLTPLSSSFDFINTNLEFFDKNKKYVSALSTTISKINNLLDELFSDKKKKINSFLDTKGKLDAIAESLSLLHESIKKFHLQEKIVIND